VQIPNELIESLRGVDGFVTQAFEEVHAAREQITSIRVNPSRVRMQGNTEQGRHPLPDGYRHTILAPVPWCRYGYYLSSRPSFTFDPLFHAGCYYVQEASSMFLEQALLQVVDLSKPLRVLDLCAAPGGKSTHIQSLISTGSLMVSNEVIKSRAHILRDNMIKWGSENVVVTNNDPKDFARLENYFDVIVVDAPCSGSGLFRRDEEAIDEWSVNTVALCSERQQRILADVWPALKCDGVLIYSTCSYSKEEDEDILDWITKEFAVSSLPLAIDREWNICEIKSNGGSSGYRFWPYRVKGEGLFVGCFQKKDHGDSNPNRVKNKAERLTNKEAAFVRPWISEQGHYLYKHNNSVYALTATLANEIDVLISFLRIIYAGTVAGELFNDKLVPAHSLAMSALVNKQIRSLELDLELAIRYLQKKDLDIGREDPGWHVVKYEGYNLGWVKVLPNRVNNYYPKELRILKDI
jgi:16S rRNA C967 or C1407 C5-methylase (RsmB/RsmF family)/NOL1/NOP2/fmu family ribosome biogenesis protein